MVRYAEVECSRCHGLFPGNVMKNVTDRVRSGETVTPTRRIRYQNDGRPIHSTEQVRQTHYADVSSALCPNCASKRRTNRVIGVGLLTITALAGLGILSDVSMTNDQSAVSQALANVSTPLADDAPEEQVCTSSATQATLKGLVKATLGNTSGLRLYSQEGADALTNYYLFTHRDQLAEHLKFAQVVVDEEDGSTGKTSCTASIIVEGAPEQASYPRLSYSVQKSVDSGESIVTITKAIDVFAAAPYLGRALLAIDPPQENEEPQEQPTPAPDAEDPQSSKQPDDTVFSGGDAGTLTCSVGQHRPLSVGWRMDDGEGSVTVNGEAVQGKAMREWSPAPNKIVSWIEVTRGPTTGPRAFSIDDDGSIDVDNGEKGECVSSR